MVITCNNFRCNSRFVAKKPTQIGLFVLHNQKAVRVQKETKCPHCGSRDRHWVYREDVERNE